MDFEKFALKEKVPVDRYIEAVFQQLADEQDFEVEVIPMRQGFSFRLQIIPEPGSPERVTPTYEELETFRDIALGRMRDTFSRTNWLEGLTIDIETAGVIKVDIDGDKLRPSE